MARLPNSDRQVDAILLVARELCGIREQMVKQQDNNSILKRLEEMETNMASVIAEFAAKQGAFNTRQSQSLESLTKGLEDLTGDVQTLNDKITELQNSPGEITPEDQALLDAIEARGEAITAKLEALDTLTPPKPPVG